MKLFLKFIIYLLVMVCLVALSIRLYNLHSDVQLAILLPGLFILVYSWMNDDIGIKQKFRFSKEK
ncbi:MAG: hypothetical protein JWR38_2778 [Mucilaginibacter sp.]|nr:hypothetical protein [Mucilaginibacter sp.]